MNLNDVLASLKGRTEQPSERRQEQRTAVHERAVVCWKDHLGFPKAHSITIVNVSSGGVAFSSPDHLPVGQVIAITTLDRSLDGVIRHVRKTARGYYLGAEVTLTSSSDDAMSAIRALAEDQGERGEE